MTINRDDLLGKIRALLSKTTENGCTEAEALAALDKARAMMDAYEVTEADLELTREQAAVMRGEGDARDPHKIKWQMASAVAAFCECRVWRNRAGLVFCGLPADAQFAEWLLGSLAEFVRAELARHLMGSLAPRGERRFVINGFILGCAGRISQRLTDLTRQSKAGRDRLRPGAGRPQGGGDRRRDERRGDKAAQRTRVAEARRQRQLRGRKGCRRTSDVRQARGRPGYTAPDMRRRHVLRPRQDAPPQRWPRNRPVLVALGRGRGDDPGR
jgi:hypothetical protein